MYNVCLIEFGFVVIYNMVYDMEVKCKLMLNDNIILCSILLGILYKILIKCDIKLMRNFYDYK